MAFITNLTILQHIEAQMLLIKKASGYTNDVKFVDREYKERKQNEYPFIFINDIDDKYECRICKDLYKKVLLVQIIGFVYDDKRGSNQPQLGTNLQLFKNDLTKCLAADTYFNSTDCILHLVNIETLGEYVPPNAAFVCNIAIQHFNRE